MMGVSVREGCRSIKKHFASRTRNNKIQILVLRGYGGEDLMGYIIVKLLCVRSKLDPEWNPI